MIDPVIDQWFNGISNEDQVRQAPISHLIRQALKSSKEQELMQEQFPEKGRQFTLISDQSDQIIKEQGIVEAFELLEFTNKVQCTHCQRYVTSGHICCCFGRAHVYAHPNPVIAEQTRRSVKQQFELLTTPAFLLVKGPNKRQSQEPSSMC